ncbi:hypothetical protein ElyMa_002464700 [Elysia marginata]|uniref:DDE Tnp4 domain-containing protein n=1 Tax=Elysia marginata TaxID=1093978 RepID=A0AAV4GN37_9GAST|nr:hypothetical protein ElyMa_002464700 [Elysia marginata]
MNTVGFDSTTPKTAEEWEAVATAYYEDWQFPNCLGALDGKHIAIQAPPKEGSAFFNYKGFHSIILLALVDAKYRFLYVDVGANGRSGDAGVFKDSTLLKGIEEGRLGIPEGKALPSTDNIQPMVIVGDDAFPLRKFLLKPYPDRLDDCSETERSMRRVFDYRLSRARRCAEHAFGLLVQRFGIFKTAINLTPEKVTKLTLAAVALHNFLISNKDIVYMQRPELGRGECLPSLNAPKDMDLVPSMTSHSVRDSFKSFFNGVGRVPWQENLAPRKTNQ